jgi:UDP-N-acetylmuramyl pentapeptide phosphotransferase/UDP-N-acetylglucosamine-1-phosphate transferase
MSERNPRTTVAGLIDDLRQLLPDGTFHILIAKGTPVTETLHAAYLQSRHAATNLLGRFRRLGFDPPYQFMLVTEDGMLVDTGAFDLIDGADEMAWVTCMFLELGLVVAFAAADSPSPCGHRH